MPFFYARLFLRQARKLSWINHRACRIRVFHSHAFDKRQLQVGTIKRVFCTQELSFMRIHHQRCFDGRIWHPAIIHWSPGRKNARPDRLRFVFGGKVWLPCGKSPTKDLFGLSLMCVICHFFKHSIEPKVSSKWASVTGFSRNFQFSIRRLVATESVQFLCRGYVLLT